MVANMKNYLNEQKERLVDIAQEMDAAMAKESVHPETVFRWRQKLIQTEKALQPRAIKEQQGSHKGTFEGQTAAQEDEAVSACTPEPPEAPEAL